MLNDTILYRSIREKSSSTIVDQQQSSNTIEQQSSSSSATTNMFMWHTIVVFVIRTIYKSFQKLSLITIDRSWLRTPDESVSFYFFCSYLYSKKLIFRRMSQTERRLTSISPECNDAKRNYDDCFNQWFHNTYMRRRDSTIIVVDPSSVAASSSSSPCDELLKVYLTCVIKVNNDNKMSICSLLFKGLKSHSSDKDLKRFANTILDQGGADSSDDSESIPTLSSRRNDTKLWWSAIKNIFDILKMSR